MKIDSNVKKTSVRNLNQYKNLTDEEFEEVWIQKTLDLEPSKEFEKRIDKKLEAFSEDYDISDLKINDKETLRALIQALISLEDYEQAMFKLRGEGINSNNLQLMEKVNKMMSDLRSDVSKLQNDLNITRRYRKSDKEASVINYIDSLKEKAREFIEAKHSYIYCECGMLLGTVWTLYPNEPRNKIQLVCNRKLEDGTICGKKTTVTTDELQENNGTNKSEIIPEGLL